MLLLCSYLLSTDGIPINREIPSVESRYEHNSNTYDLCISILLVHGCFTLNVFLLQFYNIIIIVVVVVVVVIVVIVLLLFRVL